MNNNGDSRPRPDVVTNGINLMVKLISCLCYCLKNGNHLSNTQVISFQEYFKDISKQSFFYIILFVYKMFVHNFNISLRHLNFLTNKVFL